MSYPKTLGELWDLGPEAVEALEAAEHWEREATERTLADELAEEQAQWMRDTLQELRSLTNLAYYQSERSPNEVRKMVQGFWMRARLITEATLLFLFLLVIFAIAGGLDA